MNNQTIHQNMNQCNYFDSNKMKTEDILKRMHKYKYRKTSSLSKKIIVFTTSSKKYNPCK